MASSSSSGCLVLVVLGGLGAFAFCNSFEPDIPKQTTPAKNPAQVSQERERREADLKANAPDRLSETRTAVQHIADAPMLASGLDAVGKQLEDATWTIARLQSAAPDTEGLAAAQVELAAQRVRYHLASATAQLARADEARKAKKWIPADEALAAAKEDLELAKKLGAKPKQVNPGLGRVKTQRRRIGRRVKEAREEIAYQELCGPKPARYGLDGELLGSERVVAEIAHDPDSVDVEDCERPLWTQNNCWVVKCNVRARNAFGAMRLQRVTFSQDTRGIRILKMR